MERIEGVLTPPLHQFSHQKVQKPHQHRQAALRRFLATFLAIGRVPTPGFDHAHPQGVH
jgi:hypothetical protein